MILFIETTKMMGKNINEKNFKCIAKLARKNKFWDGDGDGE